MNTSARILVTVPKALVHLAPNLAHYKTAFGQALSFDGQIRLPSMAMAATPSEEGELVAGEPWHLASLVTPDHLSGISEEAIAIVTTCMRAVDAATPQLGTIAREAIRASWLRTARWVLAEHDGRRGQLERFAISQLYRVRREFLREVGVQRLWRELRDERQREAAGWDAGIRSAYLWWWRGRIIRLQRRHNWHIPGFAPEDVAGELLASLIKALDADNIAPFVLGGSPGVEGTFSFLVREKRVLQRRNKVREIPREIFVAMHERTPTGEDLVVAKEQKAQAQAVMDRAPERLSTRQRRYYTAVLEDVSEHGHLSEARVAEQLNVDRSAISRAMKKIIPALRKSGADDVLEGMQLGERRAKRRRWRVRERETVVWRPPLPPVARLWPQPPWLDPGDHVILKGTGAHGIVTGVEHTIVGPLYRVQFDDEERGHLTRDELECPRPFVAPF